MDIEVTPRLIIILLTLILLLTIFSKGFSFDSITNFGSMIMSMTRGIMSGMLA